MKKETRRFERLYLRERNRIEKKGINMAQSALIAQYRQFLEDAKRLQPSQWIDIKIKSEPIQNFFDKFYPMSGELGLMTRNHLINTKADDAEYLSVYQTRMQHLVRTKTYSDRIVSITNTTNERIDKVISELLTDAEIEGWGVDKIRIGLIDRLGESIRGNVLARAQGIAQTEMISASNQASTYAADSTGLEYRKFWSTSHLQGIRPTHTAAEQESIQRNGLKPEETFGNGLLYPGDPNGDASEIINCRCTILHEIV